MFVRVSSSFVLVVFAWIRLHLFPVVRSLSSRARSAILSVTCRRVLMTYCSGVSVGARQQRFASYRLFDAAQFFGALSHALPRCTLLCHQLIAVCCCIVCWLCCQTETCFYTEMKIWPGKGRRFIRRDGRVS